MILMIDNYDSFTYNLVQYLGELGAEVCVRRNDQATVSDVAEMRPDRIVISPGPGRPEQAGITLDVIRCFGDRVPILGVCLGHQGIGLAFGGRVNRAPLPMHGKVSTIDHDGRGIFQGVAVPLVACRYHSLIVEEDGLPAELEVCARAREDGTIMGIRHRTHPIHGVQFHPEAILTEQGRQMLRNFIGGGR